MNNDGIICTSTSGYSSSHTTDTSKKATQIATFVGKSALITWSPDLDKNDSVIDKDS